jgi:hypothetical protein
MNSGMICRRISSSFKESWYARPPGFPQASIDRD